MKYNKNSFRNRLLDWYRHHQRQLPWRNSNDPYAIWVSEVMLQQTTVKTVLPYYKRFLDQLPTVKHLAQSDLQSVLKLWEGLGYYARARNLHRAAQIVCLEYHGRIPSDMDAIKSLPGVGDYIAAAVLSIAFNQPFAVVDGNVKRVLARLDLISSPVNRSSSHRAFKKLATELLDTRRPGTFNQAIMELGAIVCKPRQPLCVECPVQMHCRAYSEGKVDAYPKRIKKSPVPTHHVAVGVVFRDNQVLITRRKAEGLLGGLWEFPGGRIKKGETPKEACIREIMEEVGLKVTIESFLIRIHHAYTHFKVVMDVFCCNLHSGHVWLNGPTDYRWVELTDLTNYPFPKANHKIFPLLKIGPDRGSNSPHPP
jgi:A/G-specific adenine glycosylase